MNPESTVEFYKSADDEALEDLPVVALPAVQIFKASESPLVRQAALEAVRRVAPRHATTLAKSRHMAKSEGSELVRLAMQTRDQFLKGRK
jgi:hypothetical protein